MFEETYTSGEQILKVETRRLHGVRTCQRPLCEPCLRAQEGETRELGGTLDLLCACLGQGAPFRPQFLICSAAQSCPTLCDPTGCSTPGLPVLHHLPRVCSNSCPLTRWCHPTISSCHLPLLLPSIFPSIHVFSNESFLCIRWPNYWSFSFSPSNEYSGLISFRIDWFDFLTVQGTLKSLKPHSSKA